jgi:glucose/mannose transport system substrate-binding protein
VAKIIAFRPPFFSGTAQLREGKAMMSQEKQKYPDHIRWLFVASMTISMTFAAEDNDVEVFHYWTTASEAKSIAVLERLTTEQGLNWVDATVEGAAGENAFDSLEDRVLEANAPDIGQIKGRDIQRWARLGILQPLSSIDANLRWQSTLPEAFLDHLKLNDELYAIPIHIHRTNWLWISKEALRIADLPAPKTWTDFINLATELRNQRVPVIAQSLDAWQIATMFEGLVLSTHGPDFYRKVFIDLSFRELRSPEMAEVFKRLREMQQFFILNQESKTWDANAISVADGESAMMFMGDWMKGELANKSRWVGEHYVCVPTPGQYQGFIYDVNSFASFKNRKDREDHSIDVLNLVLSSEFQTEFNVYKGSMPIHDDVDVDQFDACTQAAMASFKNATANESLVPSIAHGLANINGVQHGLFDGLITFINDPEMTPSEGAKNLAKEMRYGAYYITN